MPESSSESVSAPSSQTSGTHSPIRSTRVGMWLRIAILTVFAIFTLIELTAYICQSVTVSRLTALARKNGNAPLLLTDVEPSIMGWAGRKDGRTGSSKLVIYSWPSITRYYKLRAKVNSGGHIMEMDVQPQDDNDFDASFISGTRDGVQTVQSPASVVAESKQFQRELPDKIRKAFAEKRRLLSPGLVIFPIVDTERKITATGAALSMIVQNSLISTPKRRMELDPSLVRQSLVETDTWVGGTTVDQDRVNRCLATIGAVRHVLPRTELHDGRTRIVMEINGTGDQNKPTLEVDTSNLKLNMIPGALAVKLFEYLNEELSPEERSWVTAPQFQTEMQAEEFVRQVDLGLGFFTVDRFKKQFLDMNPNWVAGWDVYLEASNRSFEGADQDKGHGIENCATIARHGIKGGKVPGESLLAAIKLERQAELPFQSLVKLAAQFPDKSVAKELISIWETEDNSYIAHVERARHLIVRSWAMNAERWTTAELNKAKAEQTANLERAERELKLALEINPAGWAAHGEMVSLAVSKGLPMEVMQRHFEAATRFSPKYFAAWKYKSEYLAMQHRLDTVGRHPRVAWDNKAVFQFADECLQNGQWSRQIPQLIPQAFRDITVDSFNYSNKIEILQSAECWDRIARYWDAAQQQSDPETRRKALNYFAYQAAISGHYVEGAPAFDQLDKQTIEELPPEVVDRWPPSIKTDYIDEQFQSEFRYFQLRDLVHAHSREGIAGIIPKVRNALANFKLDEAEQALTSITPESAEDQAEVQRLQRALAVGRRLQVERKIRLTAKEMQELFAEVKRLSCRGISQNPYWQASEGKLVFQLPAYSRKNGWTSNATLFFPIGMKHLKINGEFNYSGPLHSVRIISRSQAFHIETQMDYQGSKVRLLRELQQVLEAPLAPKPFAFELVYALDEDWLSPTPTISWYAPVVHDVPGTFGLSIYGIGQPIQFSLSELTIELRD